MNPLKMPPQIIRLVLLSLGIIGSYAVARLLLVPASFGEYGWFRGAALEEVAAAQPVYAGMKSCDECHSEILAQTARFEHKTIACESCHGPSRAHAGDPDTHDPPKGKLANSDCLRCHQGSASRPAWLKQVEPVDHYHGDRCTECHLPHQPKEIR